MGYSGKAKPGYEKPPASMVMTRIGGHDYPLHSEPLCKTCQSPHRLWIENALLLGRTYFGIAEELTNHADSGSLGHPSKDNIADHYRKGHMPLPQAVKRRMIERRGEQIGARMDDSAEQLVDKLTVAQMVMTYGYERMVEGEIAPSIGETLAAARLVQDIESKMEGGVDQEAWMAAMMIFLEDARKLMNDEQWFQFTRTLASNPVLKAISAKQAQQAEAIEGTVE